MDSIIRFMNALRIESFEYPIALLLLAIIPIYIASIYRFPEFLSRHYSFPVFLTSPPRRAAKRFDRSGGIKEAPYGLRFVTGRRSLRFTMACVTTFLYAGCIILLTICMAGPQGKAADNALYTGIDIYFALDMSASMKAYDFSLEEVNRRYEANRFTPTRFDVARATMLDFIESRAQRCRSENAADARCDRVGVVLFAQNAFIATPLTIHYESLSEQLKQRRIDDINASQSAIGDGILKSVSSLRHSSSKSKSIILITDGDRKGGRISVNQAVTAAQSYGVKVFPILIGKSSRAVFGYTDIGGTTTFHESNFPVNFDVLEQIAAQTGGRAFRVADSADLKRDLGDILNALEPSAQTEAGLNAPKTDISLHFALLAFIVGLFSFILMTSFVRHSP